jgi:hypothetical protein
MVLYTEKYSGYVSYSPGKLFNFQAGVDKHFFGEGYRSLFLSDNASPFPFIKSTLNVWRIKYQILIAAHKQANAIVSHNEWKNKYAVFHYLSWNATKHINFGFFESVVWKGTDSVRHRGFDINYLNPVVFFRPIEYSLGSSDNAFMGFAANFTLAKTFKVYTQCLLDEFYLKEIKAAKGWWANKFAIQFGLKWINVFNVKGLNLLAEANAVRPFSYAHADAQQNYGHVNQSLAHPLGANFIEGVGNLIYSYKKWIFSSQLISAVIGLDSAGVNYGQNIFNSYVTRPSDYGFSIAGGERYKVAVATLRAGYMIKLFNIAYCLELGLRAGVSNGKQVTTSNIMPFLSIRTGLWNDYRLDF